MSKRLSGRNVVATLSTGLQFLYDEASLELDDGIVATTDQGYPNGYVEGAISGTGEITVSTEVLNQLNAEAETAGSWEDMPVFDLQFFAQSGDLELRVDVFGVKLRFPGFDFKGEGGEKLSHKIAFVVSSPDFVHLNGVPLARAA